MSDNRLTRRDFIHHSLLLGGLAAAGGTLIGSACGGGELTCMDTSALTDSERAIRTQLQYVDRSPDPNKTCSNCKFSTTPGSATACGACSLVKGPIHPQGHCSSWQIKA